MADATLRPMGLGDILDGAFRVYRDRFWFYYLLGFLPNVLLLPLLVFNHWFQLHQNDIPAMIEGNPKVLLLAIPIYAASVFVMLGLVELMTAAVTFGVSEQYLGNRPSLSAVLKVALRRFLPLLGNTVLVFLAIMVCVPFILLCGLGVLMILFVILVCLLAPQVIVLERRGPIEAIYRSYYLMFTSPKPGFFNKPINRAALLLLISFALQMIISGAGQIPVTLTTVYFSQTTGDPGVLAYVGLVAAMIFHLLTSMLVAPFSSILLVLIYYDVRVRTEGYDLEMMAMQLQSATGSAPSEPPDVPEDDRSWPL